MKNRSEKTSKKLSLSREALKTLTVRTNVKAGEGTGGYGAHSKQVNTTACPSDRCTV